MTRAHTLLLLPLLPCFGCARDDSAAPDAPDLTVRLAPGEVRAGVIVDEAALFGGIAAEGRVGDVKIYNDRAQFVIQSPRPGDYYIRQGGGVIDADWVRPEGQPGGDLVEEWAGMYGFARLIDPTLVEIVEDGADGRAVVVVEGAEAPVELITGALGTPDLVPNLGITARIEYILEPDSPLLEVRTTITSTLADVPVLLPGDLLMGAVELAAPWSPTQGWGVPSSGRRPWIGFAGLANEGSFGIFAPAATEIDVGAIGLLAEAANLSGGFFPSQPIPAGTSITYTRWYGVGPDLATLSDAHAAKIGVSTELASDVVTAPDGPVGGARVTVLVNGEPYTLAVTDAEGRFEAQVPAGATVTYRAEGRGDGRYVDLPEGAGRVGPYNAAGPRAEALATLGAGALPVRSARGRGFGNPEAPLTLGQPATLVIRSADGLPFEARVRARFDDPPADGAFVPGRPSGYLAQAWSRDGELRIPVEAGEVSILAHRGPRYGYDEAEVTLVAGQETVVDVSLPKEVEHPGFALGDPHQHAAPSNDAEVAMEDRLVTSAAVGLELHFGTDHDHVVDYGPLITALGLEDHLSTVISDELSPVLRGHSNLYPLEPIADMPNFGAFQWWTEPVASTEEQMARVRERFGTEFIIQSNHPTGTGFASTSRWEPGHIGRPDYFTEDFQAVEVVNAGSLDGYEFWADLVLRGKALTPVAVSDAHGHVSGNMGLSATYLGIGDGPAAYTPAALLDAMRAGRTVASRGIFLHLSEPPGGTLPAGTTVTVEARGASWVAVDRVVLYENGAPKETVAGSTATFTLSPAADAVYWVIAEGDRDLSPVWPGRTPWALSSPWRVDVDGDGFEAPLPPLTFGE